jgi:hypothetical protein
MKTPGFAVVVKGLCGTHQYLQALFYIQTFATCIIFYTVWPASKLVLKLVLIGNHLDDYSNFRTPPEKMS